MGSRRACGTPHRSDAEVGQLSGKVDLVALLEQEPLSTESRTLLETYYLKTMDRDYQRLCHDQEACKAELRRLGDDNPTVMVMREMEIPRKAFVLLRGQYDARGDEVSPG